MKTYFIILILILIILFYFIEKKFSFCQSEFFKNLVSNIKTKVEIVDKNNFNNYKNQLDKLYSQCVYNNNTVYNDFKLNNDKSKLFVLLNNDNIIGSLQINDFDDFDNLNKKLYVQYIGAIENKKGLFLTFLCGNDEYKGITIPLFDEVDKFAKKNGFEYILLQATTEWRVNYYKKLGYNRLPNTSDSLIKYIK
jgi:hypothetical protein